VVDFEAAGFADALKGVGRAEDLVGAAAGRLVDETRAGSLPPSRDLVEVEVRARTSRMSTRLRYGLRRAASMSSTGSRASHATNCMPPPSASKT
jgi:hypothetical protein